MNELNFKRWLVEASPFSGIRRMQRSYQIGQQRPTLWRQTQLGLGGGLGAAYRDAGSEEGLGGTQRPWYGREQDKPKEVPLTVSMEKEENDESLEQKAIDQLLADKEWVDKMQASGYDIST